MATSRFGTENSASFAEFKYEPGHEICCYYMCTEFMRERTMEHNDLSLIEMGDLNSLLANFYANVKNK